jgi:hypothetical protein
MTSPRRLARIAGLCYLVVAIFGGFAHLYVRARVYAPGDAATTAANVAADASLVRIGLVADLVQATFFLFVVLTLSRLLQHVNNNVARAMVIFVAVAVGITSLNMVHQLGALLVATDPSYAAAFGGGGSDALVLLLMDLQHYGYLIAQIFFGLWLFPLGLLAYRSGMFPRPLGVLLMLGTVCYLLDVLVQFLAPELANTMSAYVLVPATIGEIWMLGYLLIKGAKTPLPTGPAFAAA